MSNYVNMGSGSGVKPGTNNLKVPGLDDPNLSQEEKDLRLALALQQQENAIAYDAHKKRHDQNVSSQSTRTARSGVASRLANVRKSEKTDDAGSGSAGSYGGPNGTSSAAMLNSEIIKVGETTASTAKIIAQDNEAAKAAKRRNGRSVF